MKKMVISALLLFSATAFAQENTDTNPIDTAFENLIESSNNFKEYKVVKETDLRQLKSNTETYITQLDQKISELEKSVAVEEQAQLPLKAELAAANSSVEQLNKEKNSISFLGLLIDKTVYTMIVWSIVAVLAVALIIVYLQYKKSHVTTDHAKSELAIAEAELEELRRKSIEEKQRLGRQLQDERNKLSRLRTAN
ncbi:hypothetical protein [Nonlabens marinus]|uniref:tRNA (Guanine-N1)-methyltransferase n=1 Tax=Nonlabens marinus S1-08 TaxID=1454201 RepID=W8W017_9FLAO|nr:hypothetical protein [Nonlabens marinus]BAO55546.1 hypothetical protein NMS_1537 [Nonlabens marinus S1-08]